MSSADTGWLQGIRLVVTAGGTREPIDPVRYLGNRSSGKMGNAIALAAAAAGARVTLITTVDPPADDVQITVRRVETAADMLAAVREAVRDSDVLIMAAAVADYRPERASTAKLKKRNQPWELHLVPTVDILHALHDSGEADGVFVVGFAAETDDLLPNAQRKLHDKGLDLIVLNDVSRADIGMGSEHNEVTVVDSSGVVETITRAHKRAVAERLLRIVGGRMR